MRISDKTPYRNENGQISFLGRMQGTLKYGTDWYPEVMAQEKVITVFNKILDRNYILLRNFILPDTDIDVPMVLIGPPGIFLITVLHQRGLYSVRDDEWGKLTGETFVPGRINLIQRLIKLGHVLKIYLNRNGFKGELIVETIMMASNPGMHIETLRPAARVVLNDALERFAISITQAHPILNSERIADMAVALIKGPAPESPFVPEHGALVSTPVPAGKEMRDALNPPEQKEEETHAGYAGDNLGFSFDDHWNDDQPIPDHPETSTSLQTETSQNPVSQPAEVKTPAFDSSDEDFGSFFEDLKSQNGSTASETSAQPEPENAEPDGAEETSPVDSEESEPTPPRKTILFGLTRNQLLILGGLFIVWLMLLAGFIYLINH